MSLCLAFALDRKYRTSPDDPHDTYKRQQGTSTARPVQLDYCEGRLSSRARFAVGGELSSVKCCENAADGVKVRCVENAADGVKVNTDASSARYSVARSCKSKGHRLISATT